MEYAVANEIMIYAQAYDNVVFAESGIYRYTAPWFDHIEEDAREWLGNESAPLMRDLKDFMNEPQLNFIRDCDSFQSLLS